MKIVGHASGNASRGAIAHVVFGQGDTMTIEAAEATALDVVLLGGQPIGE
ncbi:MAG: hypothetical protein RL478_130, partial [Actinomycetota bacterium]